MTIAPGIVIVVRIEALTPHPHHPPVHACALCGLSVGTYEPAVFMFGSDIIHSSRAAEPELADRPGCRLLHKECSDEHGAERHLRLVDG